MSDELNGTNGKPVEALAPRAYDARGRLIPLTDEERRQRGGGKGG